MNVVAVVAADAAVVDCIAAGFFDPSAAASAVDRMDVVAVTKALHSCCCYYALVAGDIVMAARDLLGEKAHLYPLRRCCYHPCFPNFVVAAAVDDYAMEIVMIVHTDYFVVVPAAVVVVVEDIAAVVAMDAAIEIASSVDH